MNKPNILIVGPSGTGKSSSYRNLPPEETVLIDTEQKGLPFKNKFTHHFLPTSPKNVMDKVSEAKAMTGVKYVVLDSFAKHVENLLGVCRASYKGYDIYTNYAIGVRMLLNSLKSPDKYMIALGIDEFVNIQAPDGGMTTARRCAVQGKEWEGKIEKEFLISLFTDVRKNPQIPGQMVYSLMTNTDGICSAKTPMSMFPSQLVGNDLFEIIKQVENYYK